jgi:hypothetical protein
LKCKVPAYPLIRFHTQPLSANSNVVIPPGVPPMEYLLAWRMTVARMLSSF